MARNDMGFDRQELRLTVPGVDGRPQNTREVAIHAASLFFVAEVREVLLVSCGTVSTAAQVRVVGTFTEGEALLLARNFGMRFRVPAVRWVLADVQADAYVQPGTEDL